jgi:predicted ArsR family transcriptional regulator
MDDLSRAILRELSSAQSLTAQQIATRLGVSHWANLSTALAKLVAAGSISVVGPLGRAETTYRIHARAHGIEYA